eukprot:375979_1
MTIKLHKKCDGNTLNQTDKLRGKIQQTSEHKTHPDALIAKYMQLDPSVGLYKKMLDHSNPMFVIHHFNQTILVGKKYIFCDHLIGLVLMACAQEQNIEFAEKVWEYEWDHKMQPNQSLFSRMMTVYASIISFENLTKASNLVREWAHQFETNKGSLYGHLTKLPVDSPIILNQMMRIILDNLLDDG